MKKFFQEHGLWVLFATAVLAVTLALLSFFASTSSPLANLAGIVASPFRSAYTAAATWFNDKQDYFADNQALRAENQELKNQIAKMEEEVRQAKSNLEENQRLYELLNLREKHRSFQLEAAAIVEQSASNWTSALTLNRGTQHGVAVGDCVITEEGFLAGVVSEAGANWCTVLTVVDTDISLGAKVFRTEDIGLAQGDFNLMTDGKLKLAYLPADCRLLNGDLIVTSGLGGYYPAGLVIGSVEEFQIDDSGAASYAVVAPSAALGELTQVFVVKAFDIVD